MWEFNVLGENKWLSLREMISPHRYTYVHESRCDGNIISILPFRYNKQTNELQYLTMCEITPCWEPGITTMSSITGGVDKGDTPSETAVKELLEETGYKIEEKDLISLGTIFGTKCVDTIYHLFTVDLTSNDKIEERVLDGETSSFSHCEWVPGFELVEKCKDPFAYVIYLKHLSKLVKLW